MAQKFECCFSNYKGVLTLWKSIPSSEIWFYNKQFQALWIVPESCQFFGLFSKKILICPHLTKLNEKKMPDIFPHLLLWILQHVRRPLTVWWSIFKAFNSLSLSLSFISSSRMYCSRSCSWSCSIRTLNLVSNKGQKIGRYLYEHTPCVTDIKQGKKQKQEIKTKWLVKFQEATLCLPYRSKRKPPITRNHVNDTMDTSQFQLNPTRAAWLIAAWLKW